MEIDNYSLACNYERVVLKQYADGRWGLDEFVSVTNHLLPDVVGNREGEEVNPRLVRHYTSQGMLDEPGKEGKEARYGYRHLLQLLLLRRMLAQGYGTAAIDRFPRKQTDDQLVQLLEGKLELTVRANSALEYLQSLKRGPVAPAPVRPGPVRWSRVELVPGLELHIREDYQPPARPEELLEKIRDMLLRSGR